MIITYEPRNIKNRINCIFCNENTGECLFNVNWKCHIYCRHLLVFNPTRQLETKHLFDLFIESLKKEEK